MPSQTRHIRGFMRQGDAVTALLDSMRQRNALLDRIHSLLPDTLAEHCLQASLDKGELVLSTGTSAWASALRFRGPDLIRKLANQGVTVKRCRIRVLPGAAGTERPETRAIASQADTLHARRSRSGAGFIDQAANSVQDPALAESLRRLARTLSGDKD